jgi:hypothetical protein
MDMYSALVVVIAVILSNLLSSPIILHCTQSRRASIFARLHACLIILSRELLMLHPSGQSPQSAVQWFATSSARFALRSAGWHRYRDRSAGTLMQVTIVSLPLLSSMHVVAVRRAVAVAMSWMLALLLSVLALHLMKPRRIPAHTLPWNL